MQRKFGEWEARGVMSDCFFSRNDDNWVMDRDSWETRGAITNFEMKDGPVKN